MATICFLINPVSEKKYKGDIKKSILKTFDPSLFNVAVRYSESGEHLAALAKEAKEEGFEIVVAVGGDGTVQRVGKELIGSQSSLAIVPIGSGNGFARHYKISTNPEIALKQIINGKAGWIDAVDVNGNVALNVAGVGFDGHIAHKFSGSKIRGFWTYLGLVLKEYITYVPKNYRLRFDDKSLSKRAFFISVCNGSEWGNHVVLAPEAQADDGLLDVVVLKQFPIWASFRIGFRLLRGAFHLLPWVESFRCKVIVIEGNDLTAHLDGEPCFFPDGLTCKVLPHSLKLIVPSSHSR